MLLVSRVMLTNDLTEDVLEECVEKKADLIVSYHPPIFRPLKRLTQENWKVRTWRYLHRLMSSFPFHLLLSAAAADIPFAGIRVGGPSSDKM